jgi:hypothetical protein
MTGCQGGEFATAGGCLKYRWSMPGEPVASYEVGIGS